MDSYSRSTTQALDWLRFPMALCVIFIHSFGSRKVNCSGIIADPFSWESVYDISRLFFSKVLPGFAVPTFFLISGYLFFLNMPQWDWEKYLQKLKRRVSSLLIPYLGWNIFHCLHLSWPLLMKIFHGERQWNSLWALWNRWGNLRMFWDGHVNHPIYENIIGVEMPFTAPVLVPLWFLRDLMVIVLLAPLLWWAIQKSKGWVLSVFAVCFVLNIWLPWPGFSFTCGFWFAFGAWFSIKGKDVVLALRRHRFWSYPMTIILLIILTYWRATVPGPDSIALKIVNNLYVLASSVSAVALAGGMWEKNYKGFPQWITKATFFIFVSHIFLRKQVLKVLLPFTKGAGFGVLWLHYLMVPLITAFICISVYYIWQLMKKGFFKLANIQK